MTPRCRRWPPRWRRCASRSRRWPRDWPAHSPARLHRSPRPGTTPWT